jgi:hypothetical protein
MMGIVGDQRSQNDQWTSAFGWRWIFYHARKPLLNTFAAFQEGESQFCATGYGVVFEVRDALKEFATNMLATGFMHVPKDSGDVATLGGLAVFEQRAGLKTLVWNVAKQIKIYLVVRAPHFQNVFQHLAIPAFSLCEIPC